MTPAAATSVKSLPQTQFAESTLMKPIPATPSHCSTFNVPRSTSTFAFRTPRFAPGSPFSFLLFAFCFLLLPGQASAATRYVWQGSPVPAPPYTNWATAARVIQDAVDAAQPGDTAPFLSLTLTEDDALLSLASGKHVPATTNLKNVL